jgi:hypothetical protein
MKVINGIIILVLFASTACSKKESQPEPAKAAAPDIVKMQTGSINNAKKALDDSKQVNQMIMDSAAQQREMIEKMQQ